MHTCVQGTWRCLAKHRACCCTQRELTYRWCTVGRQDSNEQVYRLLVAISQEPVHAWHARIQSVDCRLARRRVRSYPQATGSSKWTEKQRYKWPVHAGFPVRRFVTLAKGMLLIVAELMIMQIWSGNGMPNHATVDRVDPLTLYRSALLAMTPRVVINTNASVLCCTIAMNNFFESIEFSDWTCATRSNILSQ